MPADPATREPIDAVTRVLVRACRALAELGRPQDAARLAAEAWVALRHEYPRQAEHLNGVMHHIARVEQRLDDEAAESRRKVAIVPREDRVLDVREEIPKRRHEIIFETFGELPNGDAYVLVNDHDPKPLYYQLQAEHTGQFSWEYLEEGPEVWRVRIGRIAEAPGAATA